MKNQQQMLEKADRLTEKLHTFQWCCQNMVATNMQITTAYLERHITLPQYEEFVNDLDALYTLLLHCGSDDMALPELLGHQANDLRVKVLDLVLASKNAHAGWHIRSDGTAYKGEPYMAEHLKGK